MIGIRMVSIICITLICIVGLLKGYDNVLILISFYLIGLLTPLGKEEKEKLKEKLKDLIISKT